MQKISLLAASALLTIAPAIAMPPPLPPVEGKDAATLQAEMTSGTLYDSLLTTLYLDRISKIDDHGPELNAVIATFPSVEREAKLLYGERHAGKLRGPLHGIPILLKDNIEAKGALPTTAGSLALKDNITNRDAPLVARLRDAGAVILGKTNLSEWANIRSSNSISGWSAVGGLVRNPYALDRTSCGSSSGSGAAVAASFAAAAVGTETDGSVVCPSSMNGLVGLKPTLGWVSRTHVVPISHSQDTPGPMARSVRDAAILFAGMVGVDPADPATTRQPKDRAAPASFVDALKTASLKGVRVAVLHPDMPAMLKAQYEAALGVLKAQGAVLVDVEQPKLDGIGAAEGQVLHVELKADLNAYLATTPKAVTARTLAQVIAFNDTNKATEMPFFEQETFLEAEKTDGLANPEYLGSRAKSLRLAGKEGIDAMLAKANATILVEPTYGMPWLSDTVYGDQFSGPSASELPAVAGYPHLTVPMGLVRGVPVGLSFIATAWQDRAVLNAGYVYEQAATARVAPRYAATNDAGPGLDGAK